MIVAAMHRLKNSPAKLNEVLSGDLFTSFKKERSVSDTFSMGMGDELLWEALWYQRFNYSTEVPSYLQVFSESEVLGEDKGEIVRLSQRSASVRYWLPIKKAVPVGDGFEVLAIAESLTTKPPDDYLAFWNVDIDRFVWSDKQQVSKE